MSSFGINLSSSSSASQGVGIDVTAVVDQILEAERGPERIWQGQQASLATQSAFLTGINSALTALKDKVNALKDALGAITAKAATSSEPGILTATAQTSAASESHLIVVNNLVSTSSAYTDAVPTGSFVSQGSFTFQVGTGLPATINVNTDTVTLDDLASYINGQSFGVTANVINDANGSRLALVSQTAGSAGNLMISSNTTNLVFHQVAGNNAALSVDGAPISSASNTITGVLPGVTLNLLSAAPQTPVQLDVAPDKAGATQAINEFVSSYNALIQAVNAQFTFNPATNTAGPLAGNSSLRSLQSSLLLDVTYSIEDNNGVVNLASMGVNMANDGTLNVDSTKLDDVLANKFSDFQNYFQSAGAVTGFANNFAADLTGLTDSTKGIINANLTENKSLQTMLTKQITAFEDRLSVRQQQLINQYSLVDTMLRQFPLIMAQLDSELGTLPTYQP